MYEPRLLGLPMFRAASLTGAVGLSGYGFGGLTSLFVTVGVLTFLLLTVIVARFVARRTVGR